MELRTTVFVKSTGIKGFIIGLNRKKSKLVIGFPSGQWKDYFEDELIIRSPDFKTVTFEE